MEEEIGKPLFYRSNRIISLTDTGLTLKEYSDNLLKLFDETEKAVKEVSHPSGILKIGAVDTFAVTGLPEILTAYHKEYPSVLLRLNTGIQQKMIDAILNYELDGAFAFGPLKYPEIISEYLFDDELVIVSAKNHSQVISNEQPLLVLPIGCDFRFRLESFFRDQGILKPVIMSLGSMDTVLSLVRAGMGITLVPQSLLDKRYDKTSFNIHEISQKYRRISILLIWHRESYLSLALKEFIKMAKSIIKGDDDESSIHFD